MPMLGADPDQGTVDWDEFTHVQMVRTRPDVYALASYFAYHPHMRMSQRMDDTDRAILNRLFAKRLDQGYSKSTLMHMVDQFYQSWGAQYDQPALAFASSKMQDRLLDGAELVRKEPKNRTEQVLNWLSDGMPDDETFGDPSHIRSIVLLRAGELPLRYPRLVAEVLAAAASLDVDDALMLLDDVVRWHLGEDLEDLRESFGFRHLQRYVSLPPEFLRRNRAPKTIKAKQSSMTRALSGMVTEREVVKQRERNMDRG